MMIDDKDSESPTLQDSVPSKPRPKPGEISAARVADCIEKTGINPLKANNVVKLPPSPAKLAQLATITQANRKYSETLAEEILGRLLGGETMASICHDERMPHYTTIWHWAKDNEEFRGKLESAKRDGSHYIADDCLRIADDQTIDPMHKRIMVDTRLRLIKSWHRKAYGDNVQLSGDENGNPVRFFIDGLSDAPRREEIIKPIEDKPKE